MLDKKTYKLLKEFYKRGVLTRDAVDMITEHRETSKTNQAATFLTSMRFVEFVRMSDEPDEEGVWHEGDSFYQITIAGRAYIEQKRRELWMFLVPYVITTAVAIASLLVACQDIGQQVVCSCGLG